MPAYTERMLLLVKVLPSVSIKCEKLCQSLLSSFYCLLSAVPPVLFNRRYMFPYTLPRLSLGGNNLRSLNVPINRYMFYPRMFFFFTCFYCECSSKKGAHPL